VFDAAPALKLVHNLRAVHYVQVMYTKYADISRTQDFEVIAQLIREMTEFTVHWRDPLQAELGELVVVKGQLEQAAGEWGGRPPAAVSDEAAAAVPELRATVGDEAERSVRSERQITTQLAEAAHVLMAACGGVERTELFPIQIERLMATVSEKTSAWIWAVRRCEAQRREHAKHVSAIRGLEVRKEEIEARAAELREEIDRLRAAKCGGRKALVCPVCRRGRRERWLPCGHTLCGGCVLQKKSCPVCLTEFKNDDVRVVNWK
jgi:rubrerythrin